MVSECALLRAVRCKLLSGEIFKISVENASRFRYKIAWALSYNPNIDARSLQKRMSPTMGICNCFLLVIAEALGNFAHDERMANDHH